MKSIFIAFALIVLSLNVNASKTDKVIGCWSMDDSATLYMTRDKKFVLNTKDANGTRIVSTGTWKYKEAVHALTLKFDDRPELKLLIKEDSNNQLSAVNTSNKMNLKYTGAGKCE